MSDLIKIGLSTIGNSALWLSVLILIVISPYIRQLITRCDIKRFWHKFVETPFKTVATKSGRRKFAARLFKSSRKFRDTDHLGRYFLKGYDILELFIDSLTRVPTMLWVDFQGEYRARVTSADLKNMFEIFLRVGLSQPVSDEINRNFLPEPVVIEALQWTRLKNMVSSEFQEYRPNFNSETQKMCSTPNFVTAIKFWEVVTENHERNDDYFMVHGLAHLWCLNSLCDLWTMFKDGYSSNPEGPLFDLS